MSKFMRLLRTSALYAPTFDKKLVRMIERNYLNPNFPTKHLQKDIELVIEEGCSQGLRTEPLAGIATILETAMGKGLGDGDYSALYNAIHPPIG